MMSPKLRYLSLQHFTTKLKGPYRLKDNFKFHIVGVGRGGTSLLAGLLDYHSGLKVGFELYAVDYLMGKKLPCQGSKLFHKRVKAYLHACNKEAKHSPHVLWGNKITTEQVFGLEDHNLGNPGARIDVLDTFFNTYLKGNAIIFILRDGRTCINSKVQRTGQPIEKACERWQYSVKCYKFFKTCHENNICVRFEDLLLHPRTALINICNFLKVPYQEEMLKGTMNKMVPPEYQQNKFDVSKTQSIDIPDYCLSRIEDDLKYCGYL